MASHAVRRLIDATPAQGDPSAVAVTLELQCGCRIERFVPEDRVVERPGGERFVVGKYPCPAGHPVQRDQL